MTLEKKDLLLPEMIAAVNLLKRKIEERLHQAFFGAITNSKLSALDDPQLANRLKQEFLNFYSTAIGYINKWFRIDDYPSLDWIMLSSRILNYDDVRKSAEVLLPHIATKDSLFDETSQLNSLLQAVSTEFDNLPHDKKWATLFRRAKFIDYKLLIGAIFAIPTSNAGVERVFSLCKKHWSDDRNKLHVETVKSLLQVKMNYSLSCNEMYTKLLNNDNLLKKILSNNKYV